MPYFKSACILPAVFILCDNADLLPLLRDFRAHECHNLWFLKQRGGRDRSGICIA